MSFNQFKLDARLAVGIQRAGYTMPTPIQFQAIPALLAGGDIIATAQTGTGKTAAFVLPMLHRLLKGSSRATRALIVTPTRELALQIHAAIRDLATGTQIRSATIYGGVSAAPQIQALQRRTDILVATPGRLLDLMGQGYARLDQIEILVLDEADRMLDMGFLPDVRRIIQATPASRQTLLFSATIPTEVEHLAAQSLRSPRRIDIGLQRPAQTVSHALYPVPPHLKSPLLLELLAETTTDSVLIFTRTKHRARKVARQVEQAGYQVTSLHGNRSQSQRQTALQGFKQGQFRIMVATDIAARGLDIESISHVINYDMPDTADAYIHRIGRTGRAERSGMAFTFVTPEDDDLVHKLERVMGQPLKRQRLAGFDYTTPAPAGAAAQARRPRQQPGDRRRSPGQRGPQREPGQRGLQRKVA